MSNKFLKVADLRDLEDQVSKNEITYSRMVEIINQKAEEFYSETKKKADQWDALNNRIEKLYELDDNESDLSDIGEVAAEAFGYL